MFPFLLFFLFGFNFGFSFRFMFVTSKRLKVSNHFYKDGHSIKYNKNTIIEI